MSNDKEINRIIRYIRKRKLVYEKEISRVTKQNERIRESRQNSVSISIPNNDSNNHDGTFKGVLALGAIATYKIKNLIIKVSDEKFKDILNEYIKRKKFTPADFYHEACISKQVFSNIMVKDTKPTFSNVIKMALALKCSVDEVERLLRAVGYSFQDNNAYDMLVKSFFINKDYRKYFGYDDYFTIVEKLFPEDTNRFQDWAQ